MLGLVCAPVLLAHAQARCRLKNKNKLDATYYFIVLLIGSTFFGHYYVHHQELATIMLITTDILILRNTLRSPHTKDHNY